MSHPATFLTDSIAAMPIYEYRCQNGHTFEVMQSMSEDPVATCEQCEAPVERVFHPVAVHFKGSGFYTTDYARSKAKPSDGDSSDGESKKKPEKKDKKEKKPDSKAKSASKD